MGSCYILGLTISSVTTLMLFKEKGETGVGVYQEDVFFFDSRAHS